MPRIAEEKYIHTVYACVYERFMLFLKMTVNKQKKQWRIKWKICIS